MSYADKVFIENAKNIIENGTSTKGERVRARWEDGEPAYTIKQFGVVNRYDLSKEFPAITLRRVALKSCMDEILWIYQKKSNNIKDLHSHIWDQWANPDGSIGKAYGYQVAQKYSNNHYIPGTSKLALMDQMDNTLHELSRNPFSRRTLISLWNIHDLQYMNLQPCCWSINFNVTTDTHSDKLVLNAVLNQRSNDFLAANAWNVCQYSILLMMIAQAVNMKPGVLLHVIADQHIYDRHIDIVKELISRKTYPAPIVKLNPEITNFYDFTTNDLIVENYQYGPQITNIPIAI